MRLIAIAATAALLAFPAFAQEPGAAKPAPERDPNEVVCKKFAVTGSLVATKKVCATRAEWSKANSRQSEDARDRHDGMTRGPGAIDTRSMGGG